ncbi:50S ribosomal protein L11 [Mycoplasma bradburyae]|uniref:Large ribosomal subunit protein uL11 n=1 Tax=Mycoplasma bradburyae TaxID=2963128 RepID=A0AAW6HPJ7_9MOLU|nr:50S ribosomal protein L11 [Mycoplasma bradburyae]MDC4163168.1 50S ribosomal protein L11 [Mycoplasma bradburyae]MDC4181782.1 50S ribosomal protein L11 [Mycoplasma bradburyae]MDC4182483.1 50S ribosomal protein L11 [Mycoplasma bradburyae]MDC4183156.1 50S ribosomal protein L11 [Mycoplasma bradburyae]MDC4183965.1 50S ribosomal protein L11 [Mycoplasma bradburyae]
MAKKEITRIAKLELIGGQAKPGPALASVGINMGEFTKQFNDKTKDRMGDVVPVIITAFNDKSFTFELKTTPVTILLKKAAKIEKGAKNAKTEKIAKISKEDALKIAEYKMPDLNAYDQESALRMIAGTAKQMGMEIEGVDPTPNKAKKGAK